MTAIMDEKMQVAIKSIKLDGRTYHNISITPTLINFFFGKNGVGKSTIAQQIADGSGITPALSDYDVLFMIEILSAGISVKMMVCPVCLV